MTVDDNYWQDFSISEVDLEDIYSYLLEKEQPLDKFEISKYIINKRIYQIKELERNEKIAGSKVYSPGQQYQVDDLLSFPQYNWERGRIKSTRSGNNPDNPDLFVIDVEFQHGISRLMASNLANHKLNDVQPEVLSDSLDPEIIFSKYGKYISNTIDTTLSSNDDLVCIAGKFFPRSLLIDFSIGHLNLCEALLEMSAGGPMSTPDLIAQLELPQDVNSNLTEFSINLALQEDNRFDEVGPSGETLWFLKRLEPEEVLTSPLTLRYAGEVSPLIETLSKYESFCKEIGDELEPDSEYEKSDSVNITLNFPHWRAGTLPLSKKLSSFFPTAYESPRIKFNFVDGQNSEKFSGWVVRPAKYIFGLKNWYEQHGLIPGSIISIRKGLHPGEVIVQSQKNRNSKDWIRTVLVGADGGIVFAVLKQVVTCIFDDRMAIVVPDVGAIDTFWSSSSKIKIPIEKVLMNTMRELGKLNPQGQIHAQELYSAVNVIRRCPPSLILTLLFTNSWSHHLGDLYFKYIDS